MAKSISVLAIIGGGRWGQVILSIIANMHTSFNRIVIVSKANVIEITDQIAKLNLTSRIPFQTVTTIDDLFDKYDVEAAIVVNSAGQHFEAARQLINRGIHVLIEKPIVPSIQEMKVLIEEALHNNVVLIPGLSYRFCSYLKNFSSEVTKKTLPKKFLLKWCDTQNEIRYGHAKKHDSSISVAQDVMPHIWTILSVIFPHPTANIHTCFQDTNSADITMSINNIDGQILLQRNGTTRQRYLSLQYESDTLALDFSHEPGVILLNSKMISADPYWNEKSSPLTCQLEYFFSVIATGRSVEEDLQYCIESVAFTELVSGTNENNWNK